MARPTLAELRKTVKAGPPYSEEFLEALRTDDRRGAAPLYTECQIRAAEAVAQMERAKSLLTFETQAQEAGCARIAGVDEAGRGPIAGPIVAAAVVLKGPVPGIFDSKQLTPAARERLCARLHAEGHEIGVAVLDAELIDEEGIQAANLGAMGEAVSQLQPAPDYLLVDGFKLPDCPIPHQQLLKGDQRSMSIAAASIVAKVTRDRLMVEYDAQYPGYGFARHKGYGTERHLEALRTLGPCPLHRRSFAHAARNEQIELFTQCEED